MELVLELHLFVEVTELPRMFSLHRFDLQEEKVLLLLYLLEVRLAFSVEFPHILFLLGLQTKLNTTVPLLLLGVVVSGQ